MTGELTNIKNAYESEGMTPEQIAESQGLNIIAVKASLMQCSAQYRRDCGIESPDASTLNFNVDELQRVREVILDTALSAEDEHLRFKAAVTVWDEAKGRRDIVNKMKNLPGNVFLINQMLGQINGSVAQVEQEAVKQFKNNQQKVLVDV